MPHINIYIYIYNEKLVMRIFDTCYKIKQLKDKSKNTFILKTDFIYKKELG